MSLIVRSFRDCDAVAEMTRREADAEFLQLSAGRFYGSTTRLDCGDLRLHWTTTTGHTLNRARTHPTFLYFHLPVVADALVWDGQDIPHPALLQHAGPDEFVRHAKNFRAVVLAVRREPFVAAAAALAGAEAGEFDMPRGAAPIAGAAMHRLVGALRFFGQLAAEHPSSLQRDGVQQAIRRWVEHSLLGHLVEQFRRRKAGPPPSASRTRVVRNAEQYLLAADAGRVAIPDLCRAVGVSRRTLEYAFRTIYGVSPLQYMQARQLAMVRRALRDARPDWGAVKRAAYEAGFTEMGRFSVAYRHFFQESPSSTLRGDGIRAA